MKHHAFGTLGFLFLILVLAGTAFAAEPAETAETAEIAEIAETTCTVEPTPAAASAMRVVIDPETGRLRAPTPEEAAAFAAGGVPARDIESMRVEKAADGTMTVRLGGAFMKAALARVNPDGTVDVQHDAVSATEPPTTEAPAIETVEAKAETATEENH